MQVSPATTMGPESDDEPQGSRPVASVIKCGGCDDVFDRSEVGARPEHPRDPPPDHDLVPRALSENPTARLPQRASIGGSSVQSIGIHRGVGYA